MEIIFSNNLEVTNYSEDYFSMYEIGGYWVISNIVWNQAFSEKNVKKNTFFHWNPWKSFFSQYLAHPLKFPLLFSPRKVTDYFLEKPICTTPLKWFWMNLVWLQGCQQNYNQYKMTQLTSPWKMGRILQALPRALLTLLGVKSPFICCFTNFITSLHAIHWMGFGKPGINKAEKKKIK